MSPPIVKDFSKMNMNSLPTEKKHYSNSNAITNE